MFNDSIGAAQDKVKDLHLLGIDTHGVFRSLFFYFFVEETPSCPKFIKWCVNNYSPSEGVIMDASRSNLLCPVNSLTFETPY